MRKAEAVRLVTAMGPSAAEKVADNMVGTGTGKTTQHAAALLRKVAKQVAADSSQTTLPGIPGVTDGLATKPVRKVAVRSKGNPQYAALYANLPEPFLPLADAGYEQQRVLSQHRNGCHVIYKAMHMLNVIHRRGVTANEIFAVLQSAPKCGGWAHFITQNTMRVYLTTNPYGLWRSEGKAPRTGRGNRSYLYVAAGLTAACGKRGRKSKAA